MTARTTNTRGWPLDKRGLLPDAMQVEAWRALVETRELLSDIAKSMKLLSITAFAGQDVARRMSEALHTALVDLDTELGSRGVIEFGKEAK